MITVYLVGPLFTEADQVQRRKEGERLRRELVERERSLKLIIISSAKRRTCS